MADDADDRESFPSDRHRISDRPPEFLVDHDVSVLREPGTARRGRITQPTPHHAKVREPIVRSASERRVAEQHGSARLTPSSVAVGADATSNGLLATSTPLAVAGRSQPSAPKDPRP